MKNISKRDYNQEISILHKIIREEKERLEEVFRKRKTFRRNYVDILNGLKMKEYESTAQEYFSIAKKQLERRDYDTASVLVLLGSLCLLKIESNLSQTHEFYDVRFLQSTFSLKLFKLLMQAKSDGLEDEYLTLWSMLRVIPVFEEEKILTQEIVSI